MVYTCFSYAVLSCACPLFFLCLSYAFLMLLLSFSCEFPLYFKYVSCLLCFSYASLVLFSICFLCFCYAFLCLPDAWPMLLLCFSYAFPLPFPWFSVALYAFLCFCYACLMAFLCFPTLLLCFSYGFHMLPACSS